MAIFTWDEKKARSNLAKHAVSFEEALTAFADALGRIFDDEDHADDEEREILIGYSSLDRLLVVSFVETGPGIRLISARLATPRERRKHEETDST